MRAGSFAASLTKVWFDAKDPGFWKIRLAVSERMIVELEAMG